MEFFINKNATLPILKLQVVKDGRSDFHSFMNLIEKSGIFFSMVNVETGIPKITSKTAGFVSKVFDNPNTPTEYYIFYKFTKKDTQKTGRFEGQFILKNDEGDLIIPIREKLFININESIISDENCCSDESYLTPCPDCPQCPECPQLPSQTPTPTQTSTPTQTPTPTPTPVPTNDLSYIFIPSNDISSELLSCDGGKYTLITLPYDPPSSGNTIFPGFSEETGAGTLYPNNFNLDAVYWNIIDNTGNNKISYYSSIINPLIITFSQGDNVVIYSGDSNSFVILEDVIFHDPFYEGTSPITLIQPSSKNFVQGEDVCISFTHISVPPSPSLTPTPTPTPTPTESPLPSYRYYNVNGYSCGNPCNLAGSFTAFVPYNTPLTIGYFYNNPENRGYSFEILEEVFTPTEGYDLTGEPGYADCETSCYGPTPTPTITPTPTPTPTQPLVDLTINVPPGATVNFDFINYTETATIYVNKDQVYLVSCTPPLGQTFVTWYQYGMSFTDSNSQATTASVVITSGANFIPSFV